MNIEAYNNPTSCLGRFTRFVYLVYQADFSAEGSGFSISALAYAFVNLYLKNRLILPGSNPLKPLPYNK